MAQKVIEKLSIIFCENTKNLNQDMFANCMKQIIKEVPDKSISKLEFLVAKISDVIEERFCLLTDKKK